MNYKAGFLSATLLSALIIALFYYWFALANRYVIFLYYHLGATPFDYRTSSRYWMSGLVASGVILVGYGVANWLAGRLAGLFYRKYKPPAWQLVWALCLIPVSAGIVLITTSVNNPTLPLPMAMLCAGVTVIGLAPALCTASMAAQRLSELAWLTVVGVGLTPCLLLLRAVELPATDLVTGNTAYIIAIGSTLAGIGWSIGAIWLQVRWRQEPCQGTAAGFLLTAVCISYLFLPLFHYWLLTPPTARYITVSANFFALSGQLQLVVVVTAVLIAIGLERLQWYLAASR